MLRREGIKVDDENNPAPENIIQYDYVFTTPTSLTFGFHGIDPWRRSGNLPVWRAKMKITPNPRMHHIYCLGLFMNVYFVEYTKYVVIPDTNKRFDPAMNLSEYFCVIGCHLIMDYYVGNSVRGFFLKDNITPIKLSPSPSTTSSLGGALRISLRLCLTLILPFLSSIIPFSNRGICSRCGTRI